MMGLSRLHCTSHLIPASGFGIVPVRYRRRVITSNINPLLRMVDSSVLNRLDSVGVPKPREKMDLPEPGTVMQSDSRRVGLVGIKIGMLPQWCAKDGKRILCTAIHFPDNQVVDVVDPYTWYKTSLMGKRKAFGRRGPMYKVTVGAENFNYNLLNEKFQRLYMRNGLPAKKHLGSFLVSSDALVQPGTHLDVRHFKVGQYINASGRTVDWGFQGAMHRWGFRGMPDNRTTKSHRRVGSIGSTGDARVWPGKRLPGHMGYEWRQVNGLEVVRINPKEMVLYVKGSVPGDNEEMIMVNDCFTEEKHSLDLPFPTFLPTIEEADESVENMADELKDMRLDTMSSVSNITSDDIYSTRLFRFDSPSIMFTEADEKKAAGRDKMRAKIAKVKK